MTGIQTSPQPLRHPWLDRLTTDPAKAVDSLLRGVAHLPGLQRASPSEALMALTGNLPSDAPEWALLDHALCAWLKARRVATDGLLGRPGGMERFIRETGEGFRAAWRLKLSECCAWIHDELLDLLRWANGFSVDPTFDLGRAVLTAGAHVQRGDEFRIPWFRICEEAATPRLRHRLDAAMLGLTNDSRRQTGGPSRDVIVGLARWASRLPKDDRAKGDVVREWRALKAAFPRQPGFWRQQWEAILEDSRIEPHPFTDWLKNADPALKAPKAGQPRRAPMLPKNIKGTIGEMETEYHEQGLTEPLWVRMKLLLDQIECYAYVTGESYYLVTSCTRIADTILSSAPGHALTLTRRALLWAPSDGHAWSVRANALDHLGQPDLATTVLWEAVRRVPSNAVLHNGIALTWIGRGGFAEAEALLRKATVLGPRGEASFVELARLLWMTGRAEAALEVLRSFMDREGAGSVALYMLGCLLVAEGQGAEAADTLRQYRRSYSNDRCATTLERLIAARAAGQEEVRRHLREARQRIGERQSIPWDAEAAEQALAVEQAEFPRLERIARVSEADLLFRLGGEREKEAEHLVDAALDADPSDAYAQVVKALAVPKHRLEMIGRAGRFAGSLPVQLALTPFDAPVERWRYLAERFPEGQPLTNLVRLARDADDDESRFALSAWTREPSRWDDSWGAFLKAQIRAHFDGDETSVGLDTLAHDALTQAVDVGWDATPQAA